MLKFKSLLISLTQKGRGFITAVLQVGLLCLLLNAPALAQTTVTYFHNDIAGSPMVATNSAGIVVWKASYKPYGEKVTDEFPTTNTTASNKIGYAGSPFDASTGLSYMGARYYDPVIGRFMGVDPVGFQEDNVHSFNRYAYANNNPYRYIDRDGRQSTDILYNVWNRAFSNSAGPNANGAAGFEFAKQGTVQGYVDGMKMSAEVGLTVGSLGLAGATKTAVGVKESLQAVNLSSRIEVSGMRTAEAGKYFGWGPAGRMDKPLTAFSRDSLESAGWTRDTIANVAAGYREVAKITPGNASALPRAEQLESLINLFK